MMKNLRDFLSVLLETVIPGATDLTLKNFNRILSSKSPDLKKQFNLFLNVIRFLSFIRYQKKFEKLQTEKRKKILSFLEKAPVGKLRLGFWGLRSMILFSHYGDFNHSRKIGFTGPEDDFPELKGKLSDPFTERSAEKKTNAKKLYFDVVIIGSGAGGGVVAKKLIPLAEKGLKIAVLESGGNFVPETHFNQKEIEMTSLYWDEGGILNKEGSMTLSTARMVGGSTSVYTGVTFDIEEKVFNDWDLDIDYSDFKKRLKNQRDLFNTEKLPKERINRNNTLFKEGAEKSSMEVSDLEISIKNCKGTGFCNLGCRCNAKMSTMNVHLPEAIDAGIELITNCHVEIIDDKLIKAVISDGIEGTGNSSYPPGEYEISAKKTVIAAGCYGTNALLMRSAPEKCSVNLGRNLTMHPSITVYGKHKDSVNGFTNFPKAFYVGDFSETENHLVETAFYYPGVTAKNIEGWGEEHKYRMQNYKNLMCIIILSHDKAKKENRILWDGKRPVLDYRIDGDVLNALCKGQRRAAQIFFEAGCDEVYAPFAENGIVQKKDKDNLSEVIDIKYYTKNKTVFASAHPQGGCAMGKNSDSVCDCKGRLRGYDNIYIADASLFPESSHVNPCLTVMALADIVGDSVLEELKNN